MSLRRRPNLRVHPGLRGRLVIALVATSLATLIAAGLTVLPPLERRLEADRVTELRTLARTARPALRTVPERDLHPRSPALEHLVDNLERRTGGRIAVYDEHNRALTDTAPPHLRGEPLGVSLDQLRAAAQRHHDRVASLTGEDRVFAATIVRNHGDRLTLVIAKPLRDTRAAAGVIRGALPLALLSAILVALALALLISRGLLRRLGRLQADARALGEQGLGHPVAVGGQDEVSEVAAAMEAMRTRLVAEEASRQEFVATASHELRTPLASLRATLELLREEVREGHADPSGLVDRADTALRQTDRLVALTVDLLDLSRVDAEVPLNPEPLDLGELVGLVAAEVAVQLDADGRELAVEGGPAAALADPAALARIVRILLDNARRHGAGEVMVTIGDDGEHATVAVTDEGRGLAPGEHERVFQRFARGDGAGTTPGAGLGLALARALARAMGGDVLAPPSDRGLFVVTLVPWRAGGAGPLPRGDGALQRSPTAH